jgi:transcriptional regulator with XRE-family HTH domain
MTAWVGPRCGCRSPTWDGKRLLNERRHGACLTLSYLHHTGIFSVRRSAGFEMVDPIDKHVGARLRMRRLMLDMSQTDVANALGLTFQQVQKYEKGTNRISASRLQHLCAILKVPVPFFFEGAPRSDGLPDLDAKAQPPSYVNDFLTTSDGLALVAAYARIRDPKVRRAIVALIEQITPEPDE